MAAFGLPVQEAILAHSLGQLLVWGEASIIGEYGFEGVNVSDVRVEEHADPQYVDQCLAKIERLCAPSGVELAGQKLAELRQLTVHRQRDDIDKDLMAVAYTQRLAQYPADVVVAACDGWANREEFWPSWAELKGECDKRMRGRKQIRDALRKTLS